MMCWEASRTSKRRQACAGKHRAIPACYWIVEWQAFEHNLCRISLLFRLPGIGKENPNVPLLPHFTCGDGLCRCVRRANPGDPADAAEFSAGCPARVGE